MRSKYLHLVTFKDVSYTVEIISLSVTLITHNKSINELIGRSISIYVSIGPSTHPHIHPSIHPCC